VREANAADKSGSEQAEREHPGYGGLSEKTIVAGCSLAEKVMISVTALVNEASFPTIADAEKEDQHEFKGRKLLAGPSL
jgi:hypothetical protein